MKRNYLAWILCYLFLVAPVAGQGAVEILNRSNVGTVNSAGLVHLKFDYENTPAEQDFTIALNPAPSNTFPVAGRWNNDTTESVGFYVRSTDTFHLRLPQNNGGASLSFKFFSGAAPAGTLFPVMGDWNGDGIATAGLFNQSNGRFYLKNGNSTTAPVIFNIAYPGVAGFPWLPVAGDWDGNGKDEVGAYHRNQRRFRLFNNLPATTFTDYTVPVHSDASGVWPIAGDWNADGKDFVGVYGPNNKTFYLLKVKTQLSLWSEVFTVSNASSKPVAGSWDGESFRYHVPLTLEGEQPRNFPQLIDRGGGNHDLYFSSDNPAVEHREFIYYNQHSGSNLYTNSGWQSSPSVKKFSTQGATALGSIFISPTGVFKHPNGLSYKRLMTFVVEFKRSLDPPGKEISGWVCMSFSNDNNAWTTPIFASTNPNGSPPQCLESQVANFSTPVFAELVSGFRDGNSLNFGVMNGELDVLISLANAGSLDTETYLYTSTVTKPWHFVKQVEFSRNGVSSPNTGGRWHYNFGINLDFTWDPVEGALYWARLYPYAFDLAGSIPCNSNCSQANPNRVQVYKLPLVPGESQAQHLNRLANGTWQLVWDLGAPLGYPEPTSAGCVSPQLKPSQDSFLGIDVNGATFVKDSEGFIARDSQGKRRMLFGGAAVKDRMTGECESEARSMFLWREP